MIDTDQHLAAICSGNVDAFSNWMSVAEPEVRKSLRRFAAVVDTEAVVQEALLRAWQLARRHKPDGRPNSLLRFTVSVAVNLSKSEARRQHLFVEITDEDTIDEWPPVGPMESDPNLEKQIFACIDSLPPRQFKALSARLLADGGQGDEDLAVALGMKTNTFLQNITRARKLLAACLERKGINLNEELS